MEIKLLLFQNSQIQTLSLDARRDESNQPQSSAQGLQQKLTIYLGKLLLSLNEYTSHEAWNCF